MSEFLLCSRCFRDQGLRLEASRLGTAHDSACSNCGSPDGLKLDRDAITHLAHAFFVRGTIRRFDYGAAPVVQFNEHQKTSITAAPWFQADLSLFENAIGVGFFYYGPRAWMFGEIGPLKALQDPQGRTEAIQRVLETYPSVNLTEEQTFYRIRKDSVAPAEAREYDSPPLAYAGAGRLDSHGLPVMYGSPDLQVCMHECRVTAEDDLFVATLGPTRALKLLDLTEVIEEKGVMEFESLDLAIHMLFLAGEHSYEITRDIARAARSVGYDGLIYPSYFSLLRTGAMPFETIYGISHRRIKQLIPYETAKIIPNLAIFGRPIEDRNVVVQCINRLVLRRVEYDVHFGPVGHEAEALGGIP